MHKRLTFTIICLTAVLILVLFAVVHWNSSCARIKNQVKEHAEIVAHLVWDLNQNASADYLQIVASHNNYHSIAIVDTNGQVFARAEAPSHSWIERFLTTLHLIPATSFSHPVIYNNHTIGRINVLWPNTSIYTYFYTLIVTGLFLLTVYMYLRLLDINNNLEQKVQDRTRTLQQSEQKFRAIFDNHYQLTGLVSPEGILISANQSSLDIINCSEEEIIGLPFHDCPWWPKGSSLHDKVKNAINEALDGNFVRMELHFKDSAGKFRILDFSLKPVFNQDKKLIYIIPEGRDITDLKTAQKEKFRERQFTEAVVESLPGIFYVCNEQCQLIRWNKYFEISSGFSADELMHKSLFSFFNPEDKELIIERIQERKENVAAAPIELAALTKNGPRRPFLFSSSMIAIDDKNYLIGTGVDISDRKRMEAELQQAQKMEAIGTLAGGIAHDFNNILSAIIGYTELTQLETDHNTRVTGFLAGIHQAAIRARDLVRQILVFSRKRDKSLLPIQIAPLVIEALRLIRSSIPTTITINSNISARETMVLADPTQIHQVTVNLCTNGYQAIGDQPGTLDVSLDEITIDGESSSKDINLPAGEYVRLRVSDDGSGMDTATIQRIFEPYFTTKAAGKGTGLGLALVNSIIREHKGAVTVDSVPGKGSTFNVYLPKLAPKTREQVPELKKSPLSPAGEGHIVCVDDEPYILNILKEFLQDQGYRTTTFENGRHALDFIAAADQSVDLLITDMTMPGMTGLELGRKIFAARPGLPVIICTGYSRTVNRKQALKEGFKAYIDKPVILTDLAVSIQQVLAEKNS